MVKAVKACGLPVSRVVFDGSSVAVIIGEAEAKDVDRAANDQPANEVDHL